jgi:predicted RND superfamily exporter protein
MTWVYDRAGTAMTVTSFTTMAAFLCTCFTPITSIASFGIFAALVVLLDFIWVMTLFCTAVVLYHDYFEDSHHAIVLMEEEEQRESLEKVPDPATDQTLGQKISAALRGVASTWTIYNCCATFAGCCCCCFVNRTQFRKNNPTPTEAVSSFPFSHSSKS